MAYVQVGNTGIPYKVWVAILTRRALFFPYHLPFTFMILGLSLIANLTYVRDHLLS